MNEVQQIPTIIADSDMRLDRWLRRKFPHITQGRIEKLCRKGEIRLDGARVKPNTRLAAAQVVRVPPLPRSDVPIVKPNFSVNLSDAKMIQGCVIYKDDHILALNKPAGLPVQGGSKQAKHIDALSSALRFGLPENPRLIHRLDKDTSGVLVMARRRDVAAKLAAAFRRHETRKIYWALVAGKPDPHMGTIKYALLKSVAHGAEGQGEKMHCIHPSDLENTQGAKRAITDYAVLSALAMRAAWVALVPITGRTHQLRAHMAQIGHPIAGDGKYGGTGQENRGDGWGAGLGGAIGKKLHLHARLLRFEHPITGAMICLKAPLPPHMQHTWDTMQWHEGGVPDDPFEGMS